MQAIEVTGKIDKKGNLKLDVALEKKEKKVKVIIMFEDENQNEYECPLSHEPNEETIKAINNLENGIEIETYEANDYLKMLKSKVKK